MANKNDLKKLLNGNTDNNPFLQIAKDAEQKKPAEQKAPEEKKKAPGRPKKENPVKQTAHRIGVYIDADLYDYWEKENTANHTNMAATINQLLKAEKERRENGNR